jgi:hypothetical protein
MLAIVYLYNGRWSLVDPLYIFIYVATYTLSSNFVITDIPTTRTFDWTLSLATGGTPHARLGYSLEVSFLQLTFIPL